MSIYLENNDIKSQKRQNYFMKLLQKISYQSKWEGRLYHRLIQDRYEKYYCNKTYMHERVNKLIIGVNEHINNCWSHALASLQLVCAHYFQKFIMPSIVLKREIHGKFKYPGR